jgi:hypothetical protein
VTAIILSDPSIPYTQSFIDLQRPAFRLPDGWQLSESGSTVRVDNAFRVNDGTDGFADIYDYGPSNLGGSLGELTFDNYSGMFGAVFKNDTGKAITQLSLSYIAKTWRGGTSGNQDRLTFEYSVDATSLSDGTWQAASALNALPSSSAMSTNQSYNGDLAAYQVAIASTITGLNIRNGGTFLIRWKSYNAPGVDFGISVDDITLQVGVTKRSSRDFNGDAMPDILFQNAAGNVAEWSLNNGAFAAYNNVGEAGGYRVVGAGDVNGDGTADVILQDAAGNVADWLISNGRYASYNNVGNAGDYKVVGTGNFNSDSALDIVLQNAAGEVAIWTLGNGRFQSYNALGNANGYKVVGTGDFNGDGTTDLLFQDSVGNVAAWFVNDGKYQSFSAIGLTPTYQVVGTGDFNGEGTDDIVFQNASGQVGTWIVKNGTFQGYNDVGNAGGYSVVGSGDYNGDGTSDLLFQNAGGQVANWTLKNGQFNSYNNVGNAAGYKAS